MALTRYETFWNFPLDFTCSIITEWIDLKGVAALDRAYCGRHQRISLMEVFGSPQCVLNKWPAVHHIPQFVNWLFHREFHPYWPSVEA